MPAPLFILTCMRSYSSLVCAMLGQHPAMYGLPELNLFMADTLAGVMNKLQIVRPQSLHGLLRVVAQVEYGSQTVDTVEKARDWLQRHAHWNAGQFVAFLAERAGGFRIMVDKSPSTALNPANLRRLYRVFPHARFLHLVRHPRATCSSIHQLQQKNAHRRSENKAVELAPEELWLRINRNILAFIDRLPPSQCMLIQGEQFLTQPELYLAQIADWLSLNNDAGSVAAMLHPEQSPYACIGPTNAPFGNDPNFLRNPVYVKRPISPQRLEGPLDWQQDQRVGFSSSILALARRFGYH